MLRAAEALAWGVVTLAVLAVPAPSGSAAEDAEAAALAPASLAAPPDLQPGRWWRFLVEDTLSGQSLQGTVVVTANDGQAVRFGVGLESVHPLLLNYHLVPAGEARLPSLAYSVHGEEFEPFRFPLEAGASWPTVFDHQPVVARVAAAEGTTAHISYRNAAGHTLAEGTYDAGAGWFSSFSLGLTRDGYWAKATLLDHGAGYGCSSIQPDGLHLVELQLQPRSPEPVAVEPFTVPESATHMALSMSAGAGTGPIRQQLAAPDGTVYQVNAMPGEGHQTLLIVKERPAGTWVATTERAGGGYSATSATVFTARMLQPFGPEDAAAGCGPATGAGPATPQSVSSVSAPGDADAQWRVLAVAALGLLRIRRRLFWAAAALFSRLTPAETVDQPVRKRILEFLASSDGLTTQEIRQGLGVGWGTVVHHLAVLERSGRAVRSHTAGRVYWTRPGGALRPRPRGTAAAVLAAVRSQPGAGPSDVARALGVRHSTVIYHARRLARSGALRIEEQGHRRRYFAA